MKFDGKVAFVTGGASGIGLATVAGLSEAGATVYIGDVNEEAGRAAAQQSSGGRVTFLRVDVTSESRSIRRCAR